VSAINQKDLIWRGTAQEVASSKKIETDLQEKAQETNAIVKESPMPFQIDNCEDPIYNSEEADCDLEGKNCSCEEAYCTLQLYNHKDQNILPKNVMKHICRWMFKTQLQIST